MKTSTPDPEFLMQERPGLIGYALLFAIASVLFLCALFDLCRSKLFPRRPINTPLQRGESSNQNP